MPINKYIFNPIIKKNDIDRSRFINLLPSYHQNDTLKNFTSSSIENLFTPGNDITLNGYIGEKPSWYNPSFDYYIPEITSKRKFYQFSASTVVYDQDNNIYDSIITYPDYVDSLAVSGAITDNQSRLFETEYYTWAPSIDMDKFLNYFFYIWVSLNSSPSDPDYITIDKSSRDKNPWSISNNWVHTDDYKASNYSGEVTTIKAQRPIIEFFPNLELYNYGIFRRLDVNFVYTNSDAYTNISGKTSVEIDGVVINEEYISSNGPQRVLILGDTTTIRNYKIYTIIFDGTLVISVDTDGENDDGTPAIGEIIKITDGNSYANIELHYDGDNWVLSQTKSTINQPPLFQLYDMDGVSLSDLSKYPLSNFEGNSLFGYNLGGSTLDPVLNLKLTYDTYGQIQYRNYLTSEIYTYTIGIQTSDIAGYYFFNQIDDDFNNSFYNEWYLSPNKSTQRIVNEYTFDGINFSYTLSCIPDEASSATVRIISTDSDGNSTTKNLSYGVDFLIKDNQILMPFLSYNDNITVYSLSKGGLLDDNGFYELPINLTANPDNDDISLVSYGDVYQQFVDILIGQDNFSGSYSSSNNYRTTSKTPIYGTSIIQSKNNLLLGMFLTSDENYDVISTIEFVKKEYRRFRNKFETIITDYMKSGKYTSDTPASIWVSNALNDFAKGKSISSPFFNNGFGSNSMNYFIPETPSYLGLYEVFIPSMITDYNTTGDINFIQGHDGSLTVCFGDYRDNVILELENMLYNSINDEFKNGIIISDYNKTMSEYSSQEWTNLLRPFFENWVSKNNLNYNTNDTFDEYNPYTWNWSNVISNIDGEYLPGSAKGVYLKYYNTFTPHSTPWRMLGLTSKPTWWDEYYGVAPYTSNNKILWDDIKIGLIRGDNTTSDFTYPWIMSYIPTDEQGYLKDPYQIGIAKNYPNENDKKIGWVFGDCGPVEILWRISSEYSYSITQANYLAAPSKFITESWDSVSTTTIMSGTTSEQIINSTLNRRMHYSDYTIHNELINGSYIRKIGSQQFVVDYMASKTNSITDFADSIRNLSVRLVYKLAGYTDRDQITLTSDSSDIIPEENFDVILYNSPVIAQYFYSGVLFRKVSNGYQIYGFDNNNPYFNIYEMSNTSQSQNITITDTVRHQIITWEPYFYYPKGTVVLYNTNYYECVTDHNSQILFTESNWVKVERPEITSTTDCKWYSKIVNGSSVVRVNYGTIYKTIQDVVTFLNGYQYYLETVGFSFISIVDDNILSDFRYTAKNFMAWSNTSLELDSFFVSSPSGSVINYSTEYGEIENIEDTSNGYYGIINRYGTSISPYDISFSRSTGGISVTALTDEIYGFRVRIYETEHIIVLDNKTVFNDVLYNPIFNIRQPRLKISGFKSGDWYGRYDAPGFIITGNSMTPNFERSADNFRRFFDTTYSFDNTLQERAWANIGFYENDDLTELSLSKTNQFDLYRGAIQNKGTVYPFERLLNSKTISNNKDIKFYEEWAFRVGDYGGESINNMMSFSLKQSDITNNPQLIEFNSQTFDDTDVFYIDFNLTGSGSELLTLPSNIEISKILITNDVLTDGSTVNLVITNTGDYLIKDYNLSENYYYIDFDSLLLSSDLTLNYIIKDDNKINLGIKIYYNNIYTRNITSTNQNVITLTDVVSSKTGEIISKDPLWRWRLFDGQVDWSKKYYNQIEDGFFPNAGYVKYDTVDYFCKDTNSFDTKYFDVLSDNSSKIITSKIDFNFGDYSSPKNIIKTVLTETSTGYYRINKITFDVTSTFNNPIVINIGRQDQIISNSGYSPDCILSVPYQNLQEVGTLEYYPSELWASKDYSDNSILIQYFFSTSALPLGSGDVENKICYDKIISSVSSVYYGSLTISIEMEILEDSFIPDERIWLYEDTNLDWMTYKLKYDGDNINDVELPSYTGQGSIVSLSTSNNFEIYGDNTKPLVLSGVQNLDPSITTNLYPKTKNSRTVDIDYNTSNLKLIKTDVNANMNLTNLTVNIIEPFVSEENQTTGIDIGTEDNTTLLAQSSTTSNPSPSVPSFSQTEPVTVHIPNSLISVFSDANIVYVDVTRSGNIFALPNTCTSIPTTTVDWEVYAIDQNNNYLDGNGNISTVKVILQNGTVTFDTPENSDTTYVDYWDKKVAVTLDDTYEYMVIELTNPVNAVIGSDIKSTIDLIVDPNNVESTYLNPQIPGKSVVNTAYFNLNMGNDYIIISVNDAISGSATITLEYEYLNGFELYDINDNPFVTTSLGNGGNIFRYVNTRFDAITDVDNTLFQTGDIIEVDNNESWNICKYNGTSFDVIYSRTPKIDNSLIKDVLIYTESDNTEEVLDVYDPYKGILPSKIIDNVDYILEYDPAKYDVWNDKQVGRYWWDISKVKYLDYENFDDNYKIRHWGQILPDTEVVIYTWVKSPVNPNQWNDYILNDSYFDGYDQNPSGTVPEDLSEFNWREELTYDEVTDLTTTSYYFWVSNMASKADNPKTLSAYGVQQAITNPLTYGISYTSVIDSNKIIIGGIKNYIDDSTTSMKIEWISDKSDMIYHKEWELVRYNDANNLIPSQLWNKMRDCLSGFNKSTTDTEYNFVLIDAIISQDYIVVEYNELLTNIQPYGIVRIGNDWYSFTTISGTRINLASKLKDTYSGTITIPQTNSTNISVPNTKLTEYEQNGSNIRPSQSWYPMDGNLSSRYARKVFVQEFNNILSKFRALDEWYDIDSIFTSGTELPENYTYKTDDTEYMNILVKNKVLNLYDTVLLIDASISEGFWILYEYNPYSCYSDGNYVIKDAQRYRLKDGEFWQSIDWYMDGYSIENYPIYTFDSISDMTSNIANIDITLLNGTLIKVNTQNLNDTRWSWYVYDGNNWTVVAKEKATIQLSDAFYENTTVYGVNDVEISDIKKRDGTNELIVIIDAIYDKFFSITQISQLFFTMVRLSISMNKNIDWVFKTSFLYLGGYREKLKQTPVDFVNHVDNIINYVNVMKPYHVTIRDYINAVSIGPDIANTTVTDFDFPSYTDQSIGGINSYRILKPFVKSPLNHNDLGDVIDTNIVNSSEEWSYWYDNYLNTNNDPLKWDENYNPIRKKIITIKFDRVGDYTDSEIDSLPDGIRQEYEFKGTYVTSPNFTNGDWSEFPWDYYSGWENELNYFTGDAGNSSTSNPTLDTSTSSNNKLPVDYARRDFDVEDDNNINDDNYSPDSIDVDGNKFIQPDIDANRPGEKVPTKIYEPITIISTMIDDNSKVIQKYMITKDSIDTWEIIDMSKGYGSLIEDNISSIEFDTNGISFHDPNNPSQELLDEVKLAYVENGYTQDQIDKLISRIFPGVLFINNERILYWNVTKGSGNILTVSNLQRNVNGLLSNKSSEKGDKIYDGSILSWVTMDNMKMNRDKNTTPIVDYNLVNNVWTLGNLNICYNK